MGRFRLTLFATSLVGGIFTGLFFAMWVANGLGQMDAGGVAFLSVIAVFTTPLLVGSILVWNRQRWGLGLLKFGSVLLIVRLSLFVAVWRLGNDPEYQAHMGRDPG